MAGGSIHELGGTPRGHAAGDATSADVAFGSNCMGVRAKVAGNLVLTLKGVDETYPVEAGDYVLGAFTGAKTSGTTADTFTIIYSA